jgi:HPt (histidine-containing phosphotransfer) domain-containing protein
MAKFETFDPEELLREFVDRTTVAELAAIVRDDIAEYATALERAATEGDLDRVREVAHALKGAAGTVAAGPVCELAGRVESGLRQGEQAAAQFAPALVEACRRLSDELGLWLGVLAEAATPVR